MSCKAVLPMMGAWTPHPFALCLDAGKLLLRSVRIRCQHLLVASDPLQTQACTCGHRVRLQILESVIKFKWAALPAEQREGIKNYTSNLIIKYSTNEQLYRAESTFISKLNLILVQILKQVRNAERPAVFLKLLAAVLL